MLLAPVALPLVIKIAANPPAIVPDDDRCPNILLVALDRCPDFDGLFSLAVKRFCRRPLLCRRDDDDFRSDKNAVAILANETCRFSGNEGRSPLPTPVLNKKKEKCS